LQQLHYQPSIRVDSESRFAIFLARILWKMRLASRENISASLASLMSLARRENCDILSSLRVWQFVSLAFARLTNRQNHNSQQEISVRLKILSIFSQDSRVKISNDSRESRYEISVCETRESCYKICLRDSREASLATEFVCETREKRVLLQNFFLRDL
jgi:hypothetical protein